MCTHDTLTSLPSRKLPPTLHHELNALLRNRSTSRRSRRHVSLRHVYPVISPAFLTFLHTEISQTSALLQSSVSRRKTRSAYRTLTVRHSSPRIRMDDHSWAGGRPVLEGQDLGSDNLVPAQQVHTHRIYLLELCRRNSNDRCGESCILDLWRPSGLTRCRRGISVPTCQEMNVELTESCTAATHRSQLLSRL